MARVPPAPPLTSSGGMGARCTAVATTSCTTRAARQLGTRAPQRGQGRKGEGRPGGIFAPELDSGPFRPHPPRTSIVRGGKGRPPLPPCPRHGARPPPLQAHVVVWNSGPEGSRRVQGWGCIAPWTPSCAPAPLGVTPRVPFPPSSYRRFRWVGTRGEAGGGGDGRGAGMTPDGVIAASPSAPWPHRRCILLWGFGVSFLRPERHFKPTWRDTLRCRPPGSLRFP